jgi:DNA-binding MarR family transcriptional regulator
MKPGASGQATKARSGSNADDRVGRYEVAQVREWGQKMGTAINPDAPESETQSGTGPCGVLAHMDDERIRLMSLVVRTHRYLTDNLGRELEQAIGIPTVFFEVLINVAAACGGRLTMSRLSASVALTTGGMTRLADRMVEAGLVARQNSPSDRRSIHVVLTRSGQEVLERAIAAHVHSIDRHLIAPTNGNDRSALTVTLTKVLGSDR